jgi:DNA-binding HxlR family transcriptional regulator
MRASTAREDPGPAGYEDSCYEAHRHDGPAIRDVLNRIGDKWSLLTIVTLKDGRLRFTELQHHIPGISQRMLTLTLRHLERDGLLTRTVHAEVPPRVEYELSARGETLIEPSLALAMWAIDNFPAIESSRSHYAAREENA